MRVKPREHRDMQASGSIRSYTFKEYVEVVRSFHGYAAPGVIIGGFMVDLAYRHLPHDGLFDIICETSKCLPDAVQLLTPCTIGNGWLSIIDTGRFAVCIYDKKTREGIRVWVDNPKLTQWPEIRTWFFRLKPKEEQDSRLLMQQIEQVGPRICNTQTIRMNKFCKPLKRTICVCPDCGEAYPSHNDTVCSGCSNPIYSDSRK